MATPLLKVEELPLNTRKTLADAEYAKRDIKVGEYFDALDTSNSWCVAEALEVQNGEVFFRYDAWANKYSTVRYLAWKTWHLALSNWLVACTAI